MPVKSSSTVVIYHCLKAEHINMSYCVGTSHLDYLFLKRIKNLVVGSHVTSLARMFPSILFSKYAKPVVTLFRTIKRTDIILLHSRLLITRVVFFRKGLRGYTPYAHQSFFSFLSGVYPPEQRRMFTFIFMG
jgi:hypothetical protein